jgi:hypothetical protein
MLSPTLSMLSEAHLPLLLTLVLTLMLVVFSKMPVLWMLTKLKISLDTGTVLLTPTTRLILVVLLFPVIL